MAASEMPYDLLRAELARDGSRPFVTFYDDATGERVELSVATFDNWVAKTAGLMRDGLSVEPGDRVALLLPPHWQALVWACSCWAIGACVAFGADAQLDRAAIAITGPDTVDLAARDAPDVVALSLRPLGARFVDGLPPGVLDYALEVPGYPDRLVPYVAPRPDEPGLIGMGTDATLGQLVGRARERATELGLAGGDRLLVATEELGTAVVDALLVPLVVGGSAVVVRHEDPAGRDRRIATERIDVPTR